MNATTFENFSVTFSDLQQHAPEVTKQCMNWCNEQHFVFEFNEIIGGLIIPTFALGLFAAYRYIDEYGHRHFKGEHQQHNIKIVKLFLSRLIRYDLIVYCGWIIYQFKWGVFAV